MAAKSRKTCLKDLMVVLRLLASTEQKKCPVSSETKRNNTFDELLEQNLSLTRQALANDATLQGLEQVVDIARYLATECVCKLSDSSGESEPSMSNSSEGDGLSEQGHGASPDSKTKVGTAVNGQSGGVAVRWTFCHVCLRILSGVREALQGGKDSEKDEKASKMDLLSISDQKVVSMVIQLVVVLGICPNLLPAVGIPIEQRSGFSHILKGDSEETSPRCPMCLYKFTMALVQCLGEPTLSMLILSRHLSDVLLSLMQLAHAPEICLDKNDGGKMSSKNHNAEGIEGEAKLSTCESSQTSTKLENHGVCHRCHKSVGCVGGVLISGAEREECAKALKNIVDKMYQPLIVRELLFLQGNMAGKKPVMNKSSKSLDGLQKKSTDGPMEGRAASRTPQWLKDVCGHLLSKCLMKKHGVQSVLRGILEGASGTAIEWKVCEAIAQLIANCPLQVQSPEDYYKSICPQVLTLLDLQNPKQRHQYGRVAVQIIHAMITRYPDLATKYIVDPLMKPFLLATKESDSSKKCAVLADEMELTRCIEGLHKVFVASPDSNHLVMKNFERIIVPVFALFCFTRHGVSHVRTALQELISTFFKRSNERSALIVLYVLAFDELPSMDAKNDFLKPEDISSSVETGPPRVELMKSHRAFGYGEAGGVMLIRTDPLNDESGDGSKTEEILGDRKDASETRALCLVEILESLRKDDVPGQFFLYLLQQVQQIILDPDFRATGRARALMIFNVLALICDKLGPSVLKNTRHMISFIEVTLTRAHHVYVEASRDDAAAVGFELETLTMALGMLSALLSGAVKVEPSDYSKLQELAPLLRRISEQHVEEEIRELANDLHVLVLAQCAVRSEKTKQRSKESSKPSKNTDVPSRSSNQGRKSVGELPQDYASTELHSAEFDEAFAQLCDPLLPVRGHALMRLAVLLRNRDSKALDKVDVLVTTFQDSLVHDDSYIYLAAIEGLVAAADVRTADVLPYLAREFVTCRDGAAESARRDVKAEKGMYMGPEGEDNKRECVVPKRSATTRLKLGEALLRATKRCGELVPSYFKTLVQAFLAGVKDTESFIRASSLSNLGELCRLAPHTLSSVVHEIFHCVSSVLKFDDSDEVRRAAVLVITLMLRGLGSSAVNVLSDILKDLYQLLKFVESGDKDETTRVHAQVAMGELESIMTRQLFPRQQLVKHINVLP